MPFSLAMDYTGVYYTGVELYEKLDILAGAARYDASCATSGSERGPSQGKTGYALPAGVCHSWAGDGRCISLLKVLYSNACSYDCAYCVNRRSNDIKRASFTVEELCDITLSFYKRNYIEGLFLSSGVFSDPDIVMERLVRTARTLRRDRGFNGYIHLKLIPGSGEALIREAGLWSDRLSANIELPREASLRRLAPQKSGSLILGSMRSLRDQLAERAAPLRLASGSMAAGSVAASYAPGRFASSPGFAPAGQSTQLIVGATDDDDQSIMRLADGLYRKMALRRVYYSAYLPIRPAELEGGLRPPLLREHRLYQADWLLRRYGFSVEEILERRSGNLDLDIDPKTAWALRHPEFFPVDLGTADRESILRVPGIGVTGTERILSARRAGGLSLDALPRMGIAMKRARFFITHRGRFPETPRLREGELRSALSDPKGRAAAGIIVPPPTPSAPEGGQGEFVFA